MKDDKLILPGLMKQGADFRMEGNLVVSGEITQESRGQSISGMIERLNEAESAIDALEGDGYGYVHVGATQWWASASMPASANELRRLPLWEFEAGVASDIVSSITFPDDWDSSENLRWTLSFFTTEVLTGDVRMQLVFQVIEKGTEFIPAWDRWSNTVTSMPDTAYVVKKEENIYVGDLDSEDMPKTFALRLRRDGTNVDDTCTGTIQVIGVSVRYKRKLGLVESSPSGSLGESLSQVADRVTAAETDIDTLDARIVHPNLLINGCFDVWQRGISIMNPTAGQYCADRWKCFLDGESVERSITCQPFDSGQTEVEGNPAYFLRYAVTDAGTSTYNILCNTTEDAAWLSGETVTLSFWAKCAAAGKIIQPYLMQMFGTGGSATQYVLPGYTAALSTNWQQFNLTMEITSVNGKTLGPGNYFGVAFQLPAGTFQIDLANVKLERGAVMTPIRRRKYSDELRDCWYYTYAIETQDATERVASGFASSTTEAYCELILPGQMRTLPTLTSAAGEWQLDCIGESPLDVTALVRDDVSMSSRNAVVLKVTTSGGLTPYRPYYLVGDGTVGRKLLLEAEL